MMKKRFFSMLLSLCLVLMLVPAAVLADDVKYTVTVEQRGSEEPGETLLYVEIIENTGEIWRSNGGVTISCPVVRTNGVGSYDGEIIISVSSDEGLSQLENGVFVRQWNEGKAGWKYDDTVWCVKASLKGSGDGLEVSYDVYPTEYKNGVYVPRDNDRREKMTFINTYTKNEDDVTNLPKTGDSSNLAAWLVLLAVSVAGVTGAVVYSRRRKSAREK